MSLDRICSQADRRGLCRLCHISTSRLITDGAVRSSDGKSMSVGLLSSENISAVLMLPRLESVLQHAIEDQQRASTQSSRGVSPTCSSKASVDSGTIAGSCDETVIVALRQLLALVRFSRHVRQAIMSARCDGDVASKSDPVQVAEFCSTTVMKNEKWFIAYSSSMLDCT